MSLAQLYPMCQNVIELINFVGKFRHVFKTFVTHLVCFLSFVKNSDLIGYSVDIRHNVGDKKDLGSIVDIPYFSLIYVQTVDVPLFINLFKPFV